MVDEDVVRGAAHVIAEALASEGCATYEFCPGDMTRYDVVVVLTGPDGLRPARRHGSWQTAVVALPNFGSSYVFDLGPAALHRSYVSEKLFKGQYMDSSAAVIADLLNMVATFLELV